MRSRKSRSWLMSRIVPAIVRQHFLQKIEGFEVEIVRRLVEHQQIRRPRQGSRQHQPAALAAREGIGPACAPARARTENPSCSRRRACDWPAIVTVSLRPPVSASATVVARVEAFAALVERRPAARFAPSLIVPASGASAPVSRLRSVVLPAPFGPTMPIRSPRRMRIEKSLTIGVFAKTLGDPLGLDDELAGELGSRSRHAGRRRPRCAALAPVLAHGVERAEPAHVALAPRGHAVAQPVGLRPRSCGRACAARALPARAHRRAKPRTRRSRARCDGSRRGRARSWPRQGLQKAPVVADEDERGAQALQLALQPFDGGQVEMVGRLVEQQDVGRGRKQPRQRRAPRLAARQARGSSSPVRPNSFRR